MNVQAHMSGQLPGQLSNEAGLQLPGIPQNVGNIASQMQNLGNMHGSWRIDPDIDSIRNCVAQQISNVFRRNSRANEQKISEMTKKLETLLFKAAASKEEYMDTVTLQRRIATILQRMSAGGNHNQQLGHTNSSSFGTMIPTPGVAHNANANFLVSSMDGTVASCTKSMLMVPNPVGVWGLLPTANGSVGGMQRNGLLPNGHQQSVSSISVGSGSNLSSLAMSRHSSLSQMIPTPGLNDSRSLSMNTQSGGTFSTADSIMTSQSRQYVSSQHGHITHNVSGMGMGTGSTMQPKPAGEGFTNKCGDVSGSEDVFGYSAHNQNVNPLCLQSNSRVNSVLQSHPSNLQSLQQGSGIRSQSIGLNMLSTSHSKDHLFQSQGQQQKAQQQNSQYSHQSLVQLTHQHQQRLPNQQHQELLNVWKAPNQGSR